MTTPPKIFERFVGWFCPEHLEESVLGDLEEQFFIESEELGLRKAKWRYMVNAVRFFRPGILLRHQFKLKMFNNMVYTNYIKTARRNMAKRKLFSFINAFGLSIGIAFCTLIYLFIQDELSFDQFHENAHLIYRLEEKAFNTWGDSSEEPYRYSCYLQTALGPTIKNEISQVQYSTRFNSGSTGVVLANNKVLSDQLTFVDPDFFTMFSFQILSGKTENLLNDPSEVVLTPEIAEKYFGTTDVIGESMKIDLQGEKEYKVVAIIEESPSNSSLQYGIITSQENRPYYKSNLENWNNFNTPTFVQLYPDADLSTFNVGLENVEEKYMREKLEQWRSRQDLAEDLDLFDFEFTNMLDLHMSTKVSWSNSSDPQYSFILGGIALLILAIACINYISLSLTASASRQREVGVRKAIGAVRNQLIVQFTLESVLIACASALFGILLMITFLPFFNEFTDKSIELNVIKGLEISGVSIGLAILIGVIAGCYPSFFLSAYKPSQVLKGGFTSKLKAGFTKPLVVVQFFFSAALIICSLVMYKQMQYVTTKDLGFDQQQVVVVPTQMGWNEKSDQAVARMRQELNALPNVINVAGTSSAFTQGWSRRGYTINDENHVAYVYAVDPEYINVLDIEIKEGRNFDPVLASDTATIIVNEALVRDMNWEYPLEQHLNFNEDSASLGHKVIGVAKDFHFLSLEHEIEPMFLSIDRSSVGHLTNMLIKVSPGDISATLSEVEKKWKSIYPDMPFDYSFLDESIEQQYASHRKWMSITGLATLFAILISSLGLFGLAGINAVNRTKEIGIRKVFGADVKSIFILLNSQYVLYSFIAFAVAVPVSWYLMELWLSNFEFGITQDWSMFAFSLIIGVFITIVTVTYHALKSANINPANTLKYE